MRSIKRLGLGLAIAGLWATSAGPILAADNGTVDAQVTVATPCILVTPESVDFGTLPFSTAANLSAAPRAIEVTNCGSSAEQIFGRGTDATSDGQTIWALNGEEQPCFDGLNKYNLVARASDLDPSVHLGTTDELVESVGGGATAEVDQLLLFMPCAGSDGIGQTVSFQAIFTATF